MTASTATADTPLRQGRPRLAATSRAGSPLVASTYCVKYASAGFVSQRFSGPCACRRVTSRHE